MVADSYVVGGYELMVKENEKKGEGRDNDEQRKNGFDSP